jgi:hypothetical protein
MCGKSDPRFPLSLPRFPQGPELMLFRTRYQAGSLTT